MQRVAVTGLLVVCILLALGLALSGIYNYRAARRAAGEVLVTRAGDLASTFIATARLTRALADDERLRDLVQELANEQTGIAIVDLQGQVVVAAGGGPLALQPQEARQAGLSMLHELRLRGQAHRVVDGQYLEFWRPLRGPGGGRGMGRRWWRQLGRDWKRPPLQADGQPPRWRESPPGPLAGQEPGQPPPGDLGRRGTLLLRVVVPFSSAQAVTRPAEIILTLAGVVSLILLVLGVVMHRAARRAQTAESELRRQESLAALGEMAAVLAHEIRTPLGSIKGNAQLIGEQLPQDDRVSAMVSEAGRLERLVNGLLEYARPPQPRRAPCDPDALATRAADIVASKAALAGVTLLTDPAGCGACLQADTDQLLQVLVNLLQNGVEAAAFSPEGQRRVVIRVRRTGGTIQFQVVDSGPGLAGADRPKLFRPFYSTKRQGTGLGLSVARQIVEQHGGTLKLEDRKEGGAQATVTLPQEG